MLSCEHSENIPSTGAMESVVKINVAISLVSPLSSLSAPKEIVEGTRRIRN